ncbi:hypothetical protein M271_43570 [Streptomyces rapamycinicus NRRL 5491]|nr:hypothetical protein [Streptomyces rapamycinicus]AGP60084.1 hypothetical protein M271_43570 [Streptomyces rapamycinicus NRRL 5491]
MKPSGTVTLPPAVVTVMSAGPGTFGGVTTTSRVSEIDPKDVAGTPPKVTAVTCPSPVPVRTTGSPPAVDPVAGLTSVTTGTAA